jgi:hypothetical protein
MRYRRTHFEQVPIAVAEVALRQESEPETILEKIPAHILVSKRGAISRVSKHKSNTPAKGPR